MSNEKLVALVSMAIKNSANFGVDPHEKAEKIVDYCLQEAQKKFQSETIEDSVKRIKDIAKEKGFDTDVTITYK